MRTQVAHKTRAEPLNLAPLFDYLFTMSSYLAPNFPR